MPPPRPAHAFHVAVPLFQAGLLEAGGRLERSKDHFREQVRLAKFCKKKHRPGACANAFSTPKIISCPGLAAVVHIYLAVMIPLRCLAWPPPTTPSCTNRSRQCWMLSCATWRSRLKTLSVHSPPARQGNQPPGRAPVAVLPRPGVTAAQQRLKRHMRSFLAGAATWLLPAEGCG